MISTIALFLVAAAITVQVPKSKSPIDSIRQEVATLRSQVAAQRRETSKIIQAGVERETRIDTQLAGLSSTLLASRDQAILAGQQSRAEGIVTTTRFDEIERRIQVLLGIAIPTLVILLAGTGAAVMWRRQAEPGTTSTDADSQSKLSMSAVLAPAPAPAVTLPLDHGLAIRVSDEMHRIRIRLLQLPDAGTATKALRRSVDRIEESLNEAGYSIPDLAGKSYHDGMTLSAHFIADETLVPDARVIGRVIRPQINFRDSLIQPAEVEVRTGIPLQTSPSLIS